MGFVNRFVAGRHLKTLRRAASAKPEDLIAAKERLVEMGPKAIPDVLPLLAEAGAGDAAADVLSRLLTPETLPEYIDALGAEQTRIADRMETILREAVRLDPEALVSAVSGAGRGRGRLESILRARAAELPSAFLIRQIGEASRDVRALLLQLIADRKDPAAAAALLPLAKTDDSWLPPQILRLVGQLGTGELATGVAEFLSSPDPRTRLEAVNALGQIGNEKIVPNLCASLRDPDLKVHSAAIDSLSNVADARAVPHLVDVLKDESEYARRAAVEVLNHVATTDAIEDLVRALNDDDDWWVRSRAADALGTLGGDRVVEAILRLIESEDEFVRRYAVEILVSVPDARAVDKLIRALTDPDWWVRERSIDALARTADPRAVEPLVRLMLQDESVAALCATALGQIADPQAIPALCQLAGGEGKGVPEAVDALRAFARGPVPAEHQELLRETLSNHVGTRPSANAGAGVVPIVAQSRPAAPAKLDPDDVPDTTVGPRPSALQPRPDGAATPPPQPSATPTPVPASGSTPEVPDAASWEPGVVLLDRYEIVRKVGGGGFGWVYLAQDTAIGEELILKILTPRIAMDDDMIKRFVRELKLTRKVTHKNVIRIHDLLSIGDGYAISMEYFDGRDLAHLLHREKSLAPGRGLHIAGQVAAGLAAAHEEGIMHRDVKPPNVLVGEDDEVKVVDFGLASMGQNVGSRLTQSGILIGTPHYMAPEQIRGQEEVDGRVDIYALGVMMYEMFAGHRPFEADTAVKILFQHLENDVPPLTEVVPGFPVAVSDLVAWAMARDPNDRPATMADFLGSFGELAA